MGCVKRECARMAKERGKIRVRVTRQKVLGEYLGIDVDSRRIPLMLRC